MSQKRMFSKQIVQSDAFMDMPQSTQLLYFHLSMEADDDGFIGSPKKVMRGVGSSDDDYKILIAKRFILVFPEGICVIKHWLIHNYIQSDRYHETKYVEQKKLLSIKGNKAYTDKKINVVPLIAEKQAKLLSREEDQIAFPWLNLDMWDEWIEYRKGKGKKLTPQTIKLQMKFLEQHKEDHVKIIENSIRNGWTGLFECKGDGRTIKKETHDL